MGGRDGTKLEMRDTGGWARWNVLYVRSPSTIVSSSCLVRCQQDVHTQVWALVCMLVDE